MLTVERLKEVLNYDPDTGVFTWKEQLARRRKAGDVAGHCSPAGRGRLEIRIDNKLYLGHRLAWLFMTGSWPEKFIDHIDGNPSNNKFENLRLATLAENNQNRVKASGKTSAWKGVSWSKQYQQWMVQLMKGGKKVHRSLHDDERDAAETYLFASLHHFGEFTRVHA